MNIYTSTVRSLSSLQASGKYSLVLDITVKSGDKVFAPIEDPRNPWDLVMGYKQGTISVEEYTERYTALMRKSYKENKARWLELLSYESVVLCCYCPPGDFCHRTLLAEMLVKVGQKLGKEAIFRGEIGVNSPSPRKINEFQGKYRFLSNFWPARVHYEGKVYASVEAAYQAAKCSDPKDRVQFQNLSDPFQAKKLGKKVALRRDWDGIKLSLMETLLREKFSIPELAQLLLDTGDALLEEGNTWGDTYWGICRGQGKNHLGKLLMKIRDELRVTP